MEVTAFCKANHRHRVETCYDLQKSRGNSFSASPKAAREESCCAENSYEETKNVDSKGKEDRCKAKSLQTKSKTEENARSANVS